MGKRDKRVDAHIAKSADFAKPILTYLRETVHEACPDCEETLKWSMPAFMYRDSILCGFAAFKQHATFGFWNHSLVVGGRRGEGAMGSFGRLTAVQDLPPKKQLAGLIRKAMKLKDDGVTNQRPVRATPRPEIPMPAALKTALAKNQKARKTYDAFSPTHKRDYLEWITEAKTDETTTRRIATAIEWMSEGKPRNWKYMKR